MSSVFLPRTGIRGNRNNDGFFMEKRKPKRSMPGVALDLISHVSCRVEFSTPRNNR